MSASEQESRLAQLKRLQEQLQAKLYSQLSSCSYSEEDMSEETKQEILRTLGMAEWTGSRQTTIQQEHHPLPTLSSTGTSSPAPLTSPSGANRNENRSRNPSGALSLNLGRESPLPVDHSLCKEKDSGSSPPPVVRSAPLSCGAKDKGDSDISSRSLSIASTELHVPTQAELRGLSAQGEDEFDQDFEETARSSDGQEIIDFTNNPLKSSPKSSSPVHELSSYACAHTSPLPHPPTVVTLEDLANKNRSPCRSTLEEHFCVSEYTDTGGFSPCRGTPSPRRSVPDSCEQCPGLKAHLDQSLAENAQWKVQCGRLEKHIDDCLR